MKITELIRGILDIIDAEAEEQSAGPTANVTITAQDGDINRLKQIAGLGSDETNTYANEPSVKVADITAVTTDAGGGMNGPKDPADIRGSTMAMYPGKVYGAR